MRVEVEGRWGKGVVKDWRKRERMEVQERKWKSRTGGIDIPYSGKFSQVQIFAKIPFPFLQKFSQF